MGDLVESRDRKELWEYEEDSSNDAGAIQPYPRTCYQGLTVKDSSEVHVGSKYVADKIVFVLPKSENVDLTKFERFAPRSTSSKSSGSSGKKAVNLKYVGVVSVLIVVSGLASLSLGFVLFSDDGESFSTIPSLHTSSTETWQTSTHKIYSTVTSPEHEALHPTSEISTTVMTATVSNKSEELNTTERVSTMTELDTINTKEIRTDFTTTSTTIATTTPAPLCNPPGNENYPLISNTIIIDVSQVTGDICVVHREQWGSQRCENCVPFDRLGPVFVVTIHFIDKCGSFESCGYLMRLYDSNYAHRYTIPENNFLYNFVIGGDCRIYEGLGWDSLLPDTANLHVGIQLWDQQDGNRLSTKQVYTMLLLLNVGRWCGKIGLNFSTPYVCITDCIRFFPIHRYFRYVSEDNYLISDGEPFVYDSKSLGAMFNSCKNCEFKNVIKICEKITC